MKTIGLIGGMSWISTVEYYRLINQGINERLGGLHSAKIILCSIDFDEFKQSLDRSDWPSIASMLIFEAQRLERAGAECIVLCANTPHMVADDIEKHSRLPIIHIADATARKLHTMGIGAVGLLGTSTTMEGTFFKAKLAQAHVTTLTPCEEDRAFIHRSIFEELGKGVFLPGTKARYLGIIEERVAQGAGAVVLGCTEIPLLIKQEDCSVPLVDTVQEHVFEAIEFALS